MDRKADFEINVQRNSVSGRHCPKIKQRMRRNIQKFLLGPLFLYQNLWFQPLGHNWPCGSQNINLTISIHLRIAQIKTQQQLMSVV